jgi:hypothetical protein
LSITENQRELAVKPHPLIGSAADRTGTEPCSIHPYVPGGEQSAYYTTEELGLKADTPWFQIYPTYVGAGLKVYDVFYRTSGGEFSDDESEGVKTLPTIISSEMLLACAAVRAGIWAQTNRSGMDKVNYMQTATAYQAIYQSAYEAAVLLDDNLLSKDRFGSGIDSMNSAYGSGGLILLDNRQVIVT